MLEFPEGGRTRREILRAGATGAAAVGSLGLLAACDSSSDATSTVESGPVVKGGTLTCGMLTNGAIETLAVPVAQTENDIMRLYQLFEPLFDVEPKGKKPVPALAVSAESNADATRWSFKLRDGVVWHDGKPFGADDVVYTIKSWGDPAHFFNAVVGKVIDFPRVRKRGRLDVEVVMKRGVAELPVLLNLFNALIVQEGATAKSLQRNPVGTGPFKYESFTAGKRSEFTANKDYWRPGVPYVDRLVIDSSFQDDSARVNALLSGELDIAPALPFSQARQHANSRAIRIGVADGAAIEPITMMITKPPFNDPRVREALKLVADRQAVADGAYSGYASIGNDLVGNSLNYFAAELKRPRDVEKAKSLLKAAGQSDLTLTLETSNIFPGFVEVATLYAAQAADAGIEVKVQRSSPSTYASFDAGYLRRQFSVNYWTTPLCLTAFYLSSLVTDAPYWETRWGGPEADRLLFDAIAETDPAKAEDKWHAVQQLQFDEGGYIIPANMNWVDGYGANVQGARTTSTGHVGDFDLKRAWKRG